MQNRPELRLPPPKQTVKMDLTAIMREVLAAGPQPRSGSPSPTQPLGARQTRPLTLVELDEAYTRVFARVRQGLGLNAMAWSALRHVSFALALGGLVEGDAESVLKFLTRVRDRAATHLDSVTEHRFTPIQIRLLAQMVQTLRAVA